MNVIENRMVIKINSGDIVGKKRLILRVLRANKYMRKIKVYIKINHQDLSRYFFTQIPGIFKNANQRA